MSFWLLFIFLLSTNSCEKKTESASSKNSTIKSPIVLEKNTQVLTQENVASNYDSQDLSELLSQIIDFKVGDNITLDSPKRFLQISILFTMAQTSNYYDITKKSNNDEEINTYLNTKREQFYKDLGINETNYINYGITHSEEVHEFLANNPNFEVVYEMVQSKVTD